MGSVNDAVLAMAAYTAAGRPHFDGTFLIALPLSGEHLEEHLPAIEISFHHRRAESLWYGIVLK